MENVFSHTYIVSFITWPTEAKIFPLWPFSEKNLLTSRLEPTNLTQKYLLYVLWALPPLRAKEVKKKKYYHIALFFFFWSIQ